MARSGPLRLPTTAPVMGASRPAKMRDGMTLSRWCMARHLAACMGTLPRQRARDEPIYPLWMPRIVDLALLVSLFGLGLCPLACRCGRADPRGGSPRHHHRSLHLSNRGRAPGARARRQPGRRPARNQPGEAHLRGRGRTPRAGKSHRATRRPADPQQPPGAGLIAAPIQRKPRPPRLSGSATAVLVETAPQNRRFLTHFSTPQRLRDPGARPLLAELGVVVVRPSSSDG